MMKKRLFSLFMAVIMLCALCVVNVSAAEHSCSHESMTVVLETDIEIVYGPYCWSEVDYARYYCDDCNELIVEYELETRMIEHSWALTSIDCNGDGTDTYTYTCRNCGSEFYDEEQTPCIHE